MSAGRPAKRPAKAAAGKPAKAAARRTAGKGPAAKKASAKPAPRGTVPAGGKRGAARQGGPAKAKAPPQRAGPPGSPLPPRANASATDWAPADPGDKALADANRVGVGPEAPGSSPASSVGSPVAPAAEPSAAPQPTFHALQPPAAAPPAMAWEPVPTPQPPPGVAGPAGRVFDPATGAWLTPAEQVAGPDPATRRRGGAAMVFHVVLAIDLAFAALNLLLSAFAGAVLIFMPDSGLAADLREGMGVESPAELARLTFLSFLMFGIVPVAWLLGTRVKPWEGTLRYLQLRFAPRDWVRGILVGVGLVAAVVVVSAAYVCATDGCAALDEEPSASDDEAPAIQDLVANLNWPLAIFIALAAGIGEEIFFRGLLQKHVGWWGQAILFGLFHVGNGYVPQVVVATAIGFLFGWLQRRGWSMWTLMLAHALYDFILLAAALLAET